VSASAPPGDRWAEVAALIGDVGRSAERARRYRALAASLAEPAFERALAIGSEVRQAARGGADAAALAGAIEELRDLDARCGAEIARIRATRQYADLLAAFESDDAARAADLASAVFESVTVAPAGTILYSPVAIGGGKSLDHFLPPTACADRIRTIATEGLVAASDAHGIVPGADEAIQPLRLTATHDEADSPVALAFAPEVLPPRIGCLADGDTVLVYARRLRAEFVVSCASRVSDEWWEIRPDAYRRYLEDLQQALTARDLTLVIEPTPAASD
jgi:hypothetical protein